MGPSALPRPLSPTPTELSSLLTPQLLLLLRLPTSDMLSTHTPMPQVLLSLMSMVPSFPLIPPRFTLPRLPMPKPEEPSTPLDTMLMDLPDSLPTPTVLLSPSNPLMSLLPELNTSRPSPALRPIDSQTNEKHPWTMCK